MNSLKCDSNANADEVLNMTMQWGYKASSASKKPKPVIVENDKLSAVLRIVTHVINVVSTLAGAATATVIFASIAWGTGMLPVLIELYQTVSMKIGWRCNAANSPRSFGRLVSAPPQPTYAAGLDGAISDSVFGKRLVTYGGALLFLFIG